MVGIVGHEGDDCRQHDDGLGLEHLVSNSWNAMLIDFLLIIRTEKRMLVLGDKPTATSAMM
jgi:hypothetical protein